jgi:hypothetical protein
MMQAINYAFLQFSSFAQPQSKCLLLLCHSVANRVSADVFVQLGRSQLLLLETIEHVVVLAAPPPVPKGKFLTKIPKYETLYPSACII